MPSVLKARQASKIREVGESLTSLGLVTLDEQAKALGLPRSTTWTVLKAFHKGSGLSARVINQMLASPHLPPTVRDRIVSYVEDRLAGKHGHSKTQLNRFARRLANNRRPTAFKLIRDIYRSDQACDAGD
jgi:hypothetical protein